MAETKRPTSPAAEEILGGYFSVLDHGFVSLVDYMGSDEDIERAARVSYGYGTRRRSATRGLIRYLRRHAHTTPTEMVEFKFHCSMPIFVARQWIRHRTACLAEGTEVYFDLPGGIERRGNQLYKLRIEELWAKFAPTRNIHRPDKQRNPNFRRDRVQQMHLRQVNEDTLDIQHTKIVDVIRNGPKRVFRVKLSDGKSIEATSDHRFLFDDGWRTLRDAVGLEENNGLAVWEQGDHFIYVNGVVMEEPALVRATLVRIESIEFVGVKETYDLEVEGPHHNFIANGIVTHNSVNEYSGRYSLMPLLFYKPRPESFGLQSAVNNQGREGDPADPALYAEAIERWENLRQQASDTYGWLVNEQVARELARIDLPLSTYTQWYWKIDLHNLLHFLRLRVDAHAQWEIQEYGRVMAGMLARVAPLTYEAWLDYEVLGARMSAAELNVIRSLIEPAGDGLKSRAGELTAADLGAAGLSGRESRELLGKLAPVERPDYTLDLSDMRTPESMAERMAEAIPDAAD